MRNIFPRRTNLLPVKIITSLGMESGVRISYYAPKYTRVGYQPTQPYPTITSFMPVNWDWIAGTATMG